MLFDCSAVCLLTAVRLDPTRPDGFFLPAADAPLQRRLYCCRRCCSLTARLPHPGAHKLNPVQCSDCLEMNRQCSLGGCSLHTGLPATNVSPALPPRNTAPAPQHFTAPCISLAPRHTVFLQSRRGIFHLLHSGVGLFTARCRFPLSCIWLQIFPTLCVTLGRPRQGPKLFQDLQL